MSPRTRRRLAGAFTALTVAAIPTTAISRPPPTPRVSEGPRVGVHRTPFGEEVRYCLAEDWDMQARYFCYRLCADDAIDARVIHHAGRFFAYEAKRCPAKFDDEKEASSAE